MKYLIGSIPCLSVLGIAGWAVLADRFELDSLDASGPVVEVAASEYPVAWAEETLVATYRTQLTSQVPKKPNAKVEPPPPQAKKPAPKPALRLNGKLIGIVTAPSRQHVVYQTRSGATHVIKVGQYLPAEDRKLYVEKIEPQGAVFTDGERTLRQDLDDDAR